MTRSEGLSSCLKVTQPVTGRGTWVRPGPYNSKAYFTPRSVVRKTKKPAKPCKGRLQMQVGWGGRCWWLKNGQCMSTWEADLNRMGGVGLRWRELLGSKNPVPKALACVWSRCRSDMLFMELFQRVHDERAGIYLQDLEALERQGSSHVYLVTTLQVTVSWQMVSRTSLSCFIRDCSFRLNFGEGGMGAIYLVVSNMGKRKWGPIVI